MAEGRRAYVWAHYAMEYVIATTVLMELFSGLVNTAESGTSFHFFYGSLGWPPKFQPSFWHFDIESMKLYL